MKYGICKCSKFVYGIIDERPLTKLSLLSQTPPAVSDYKLLKKGGVKILRLYINYGKGQEEIGDGYNLGPGNAFSNTIISNLIGY